MTISAFMILFGMRLNESTPNAQCTHFFKFAYVRIKTVEGQKNLTKYYFGCRNIILASPDVISNAK
jgi:hypothetical protein